jgi:replicative DNA helicase
VFSLEDVRATYADRALARGSEVPPETMRSGRLNAVQLENLDRAAHRLWVRKGWIVDDRSGLSADEVVRSIRRRRRENNTQLAVIDYVQLLRHPPRVENTHEAIKRNLNTLADAANADGIAYLVMSQLSRTIERREDKRPMLSDLRESGSLEERAKCVIGLYRGSVYGAPKKHVDFNPDSEPPSEEEFAKRVDLLVLKNTNGRTGYVRAKWDGPCTRVY